MPTDTDKGTEAFLKSFADPEAVARYPDGPRRFVPGFDALHQMTGVLLSEVVGPEARILVLGAGGGLEIRALAEAYPGWTFVGVDPAVEMLRLAEQTLGSLMKRVELIEGYIDAAPEGPFDGAICLLTLHFLEPQARLQTERDIHRRLTPGAPFVAAHAGLPIDPVERERWLSRYAAFALASGVETSQVAQARDAVGVSTSMISPEQDEQILRQAGFDDATLFYAAFTWRGWIAHA